MNGYVINYRILIGFLALVAIAGCRTQNMRTTAIQPRNDCHAAQLAQARYLASFIGPSTNPKRPYTLSIDLSSVVLPPDIMEQSMVYKGYQTVAPVNQEIGRRYVYFKALYELAHTTPLEAPCKLQLEDILSIFGSSSSYSSKGREIHFDFDCVGNKPEIETGILYNPSYGCKQMTFLFDHDGNWIDVNPLNFVS